MNIRTIFAFSRHVTIEVDIRIAIEHLLGDLQLRTNILRTLRKASEHAKPDPLSKQKCFIICQKPQNKSRSLK